MVGYASETDETAAQVAELSDKAVSIFQAASEGAAVVTGMTSNGTALAKNGHGQTVETAAPGGLMSLVSAIPWWAWLVAAGGGYWLWRKR